MVAESDWRQKCDDRRVSTSGNPKNRADVMRRAFAGLVRLKRVAAGGGQVWLPTEGDEFVVLAESDGSDSADNRAIIAIVSTGKSDGA